MFESTSVSQAIVLYKSVWLVVYIILCPMLRECALPMACHVPCMCIVKVVVVFVRYLCACMHLVAHMVREHATGCMCECIHPEVIRGQRTVAYNSPFDL